MAKPQRYELSPKQWKRLAPLMLGKLGNQARLGVDKLAFANGVQRVLQSCAHWHDLPKRSGKWKTAHKRFTRWAKTGVLKR